MLNVEQMTNRLTKMDIKIKEEYVSPEVKFVEAIVEKGFLISGVVINDRYSNKVEKHIVDEEVTW